MRSTLAKRVQFLLLKGASPEDVMDIERITPAVYGQAVASITRQSVDAAYAQQVLELELQRLDQLQQPHWEPALKGSYDALHAVLSIMKRRASYLGLDAPTQQPSANSFVDILASMSSHPAAAVTGKTITHEENPDVVN